MSEATWHDPHVRARENRWYIYFSRDPRYGQKGHVRAVIEEVWDEVLNGDGGPKRHARNVYVEGSDVATTRLPERNDEDWATYDGLDWDIENGMDDDAFQRLIAEGTVVPIRSD